jgi:pimeloyl-ACP methyl ester carboxylesterase
MVVLGFSLGGAIAVDFALEHPEAVAKLVLLAPQVYVDGLGPMSLMPRFISRLGVEVIIRPCLFPNSLRPVGVASRSVVVGLDQVRGLV